MGALVYGVNKGNVPADTKTVSYITKPGDTLWGIASHFDTRDNTEVVETWINSHNHLSGELQPGMTITVPVG